MLSRLLPSNQTPWEQATLAAMDRSAQLVPAIDAIRGTKLLSPIPAMLPYLVYEYGLGELSPYVPNLYSLIQQGIRWQRVRGTHKSMEIGLAWVNYTARVEEEWWQRNYWNLFQLELDRVRDSFADLERISGIARLSAPLRSVFWRGYHGFDIRPLTPSEGHWSEAHLGEYSGVRTVTDGPLWSFGRIHPVSQALTQAELESVDAWIDPVAEGDIDWEDMDYDWDDTETTWESDAERARSEGIASGLLGRTAWVVFTGPSGVIGYRQARAFRPVVLALSGQYDFDGSDYLASSEPQPTLYIEALTDFGNGSGSDVVSIGLVLDAVPAGGQPAGLMWAAPGQITGGTAPIMTTPVSFKLGESIRDRVQFLARI